MTTSVDFYFDFISPYAWLAFVRAERMAADKSIVFLPRPIVFGAVLDATTLIGPAEDDTKRRYTYVEIQRIANYLGVRFEGPPAHPFRSLAALRVATLAQYEPYALRLCSALIRACWEEGADLTSFEVIAGLLPRVGLPKVTAEALREQTTTPHVKTTLRQNTETAIKRGVFGVPTFVHQGELFWGHDRMDLLAETVTSGRAPILPEQLEQKLDRPRGADRRSVR